MVTHATASASSALRVLFWTWFLLSLVVSPMYASARSVTIDDQNGDEVTQALPQYSTDGGWSPGASCSGCWAKPDPSKAYDQTWHDTTSYSGSPSTVTLSFTGTTIDVYIVLTNDINGGSAPSQTNIGFSLDGNSDFPPFTHESDGTADFGYNTVVFSQAGLTNEPHTLILTSAALADDKPAVMLFDYAVYTSVDDTDTPSPSPSSVPPTSVPPPSVPPPSSHSASTATVIVSLPPTTSTLVSTVEAISTVGGAPGAVPSSTSASAGTGTGALNLTSVSLHDSGAGSTLSLSLATVSGSSLAVHATSTPSADQQGSTSSASVQPRTHSMVAPIIGAAAGVLVLAILAFFAIRLCRRRRIGRYLERINEEDAGLAPPPYMAQAMPMRTTSTSDHSATMSAHSLSHNPLLNNPADAAWASSNSLQTLNGPSIDPIQESSSPNSPHAFIPLKRQRELPVPANMGAPAPATHMQLQERVNVLEEHISRMAATGAVTSWDDLPPAYDTPRRAVPSAAP